MTQLTGFDWAQNAEGTAYVSGERLRVVDDVLEVYIARCVIGEAQHTYEVLRRYRLVPAVAEVISLTGMTPVGD